MLIAGYNSLPLSLLLGSFLAGLWANGWCRGAIYHSSSSLQVEMVPGTRVSAGLDKEKGQNLITKDARVVPTGRNGKKGKETEYSSNGAGKADPSQGLDNQ